MNVKKRSIESSRMKREMTSQAMSVLVGFEQKKKKSALLRLACARARREERCGSRGSKQAREASRLTAEDHERHDVSTPLAHSQFDGRAPRERDHGDPGQGQHDPHRAKRHVLGIDGARGEIERPIEPGDRARESDEHLAEGRMHLETGAETGDER